MLRPRLLRLLAAMALAVGGLCAVGSIGHAARATTATANYDYDHFAPFAPFAQDASGAPLHLSRSSAPRDPRLQRNLAALSFSTRVSFCRKVGSGLHWSRSCI